MEYATKGAAAARHNKSSPLTTWEAAVSHCHETAAAANGEYRDA